MAKAMVIAPHPDDAELAMGGTIAKMIASDWEVIIVDLTDGEPTPYGSKEVRQEETRLATKILGVVKRLSLDMPNRYLEANLENRRRIAEVIRLNQPDVLFGPAVPDNHSDHMVTTKLLAGARFEAKLQKTDMKGDPHWAPHLYSYFSAHVLYHARPSFVVDITDFWEKKLQAVKAYKSQLKNTHISIGSMLDKTEAINRYFGICIGTKYGEPFFCDDLIGLKDTEMLI